MMRAVLLLLYLVTPASALQVAVGASRTSADQYTQGADWPITCPSCPYPWPLPTILGGTWFERVGFADATVNLAIGSMLSRPAFLPGGPWQIDKAKRLGATRIFVLGFAVNDCGQLVAGVGRTTPAQIVADHLALRTQASPIPVVFVEEPHVSADPACPFVPPVGPPVAVAAVNACIDAVNMALAALPPYVAHDAGDVVTDFAYAVCPLAPETCPGDAADYCDGIHLGERGHDTIAEAVRSFVGL